MGVKFADGRSFGRCPARRPAGKMLKFPARSGPLPGRVPVIAAVALARAPRLPSPNDWRYGITVIWQVEVDSPSESAVNPSPSPGASGHGGGQSVSLAEPR